MSRKFNVSDQVFIYKYHGEPANIGRRAAVVLVDNEDDTYKIRTASTPVITVDRMPVKNMMTMSEYDQHSESARADRTTRLQRAIKRVAVMEETDPFAPLSAADASPPPTAKLATLDATMENLRARRRMFLECIAELDATITRMHVERNTLVDEICAMKI
jgi:hypothetical protein